MAEIFTNLKDEILDNFDELIESPYGQQAFSNIKSEVERLVISSHLISRFSEDGPASFYDIPACKLFGLFYFLHVLYPEDEDVETTLNRLPCLKEVLEFVYDLSVVEENDQEDLRDKYIDQLHAFCRVSTTPNSGGWSEVVYQINHYADFQNQVGCTTLLGFNLLKSLGGYYPIFNGPHWTNDNKSLNGYTWTYERGIGRDLLLKLKDYGLEEDVDKALRQYIKEGLEKELTELDTAIKEFEVAFPRVSKKPGLKLTDYEDFKKRLTLDVSFRVLLEDIVLEDPDNNDYEHELGNIYIRIGYHYSVFVLPSERKTWFNAVAESTPNSRFCLGEDEYFHPHADISGRICLGDGLEPLTKCIESKDFVSAMDVLEAIMRNYNPSSPYKPLRRWSFEEDEDSIFCCSCGDEVSENDSYYVEGTGTACMNCVVWCEREDISVLEEDAVYSEYYDSHLTEYNAVRNQWIGSYVLRPDWDDEVVNAYATAQGDYEAFPKEEVVPLYDRDIYRLKNLQTAGLKKNIHFVWKDADDLFEISDSGFYSFFVTSSRTQENSTIHKEEAEVLLYRDKNGELEADVVCPRLFTPDEFKKWNKRNMVGFKMRQKELCRLEEVLDAEAKHEMVGELLEDYVMVDDILWVSFPKKDAKYIQKHVFTDMEIELESAAVDLLNVSGEQEIQHIPVGSTSGN